MARLELASPGELIFAANARESELEDAGNQVIGDVLVLAEQVQHVVAAGNLRGERGEHGTPLASLDRLVFWVVVL